MTPLDDAYRDAVGLWTAKNPKSGRVMALRAAEGVSWMKRHGVDTVEAITVGHVTRYLTWLRQVDYSPASVVAYYGTFKRMAELVMGKGACDRWPKPPAPPRRSSRDPISGADLDAVITHLRDTMRHPETADLAAVLRGTGLRVEREALARDALAYAPNAEGSYGTLTIIGKGGHERAIPVVDPAARQILADSERLEAFRRVCYRTHLDRWNRACVALGVSSRKATFHAIRHTYLTEAHRKSGGNLALAQSLAGHASPATTARYVQVGLDEAAEAL